MLKVSGYTTSAVAIAALTAAALCDTAQAQTVWDGPTITFTMEDFADHTQPENQDRITDGVWITRQSFAGIFNIAQEPGYFPPISPVDTEWATGSADDWQNLVFTDWITWHDFNPLTVLDVPAVMHIISEDIYLDIKFTAWTCCAMGGGFSYERSTPGDCFEVLDSDVECNADGSGFSFTVTGEESCGGSLSTHAFFASGGAPGEEMCFTFLVANEIGAICCAATVCTTIPDCTEASGPCDLDGDDVIGASDMLVLLFSWGQADNPAADFDHDGTIGTADLLLLLANWGPC